MYRRSLIYLLWALLLSSLATANTPRNINPVAVDDRLEMKCRESRTFLPLENDTDPYGAGLEIVEISDQATGILVIRNSPIEIMIVSSHVPGPQTFRYTVSDIEGGLDSAIVTVNVKRVFPCPSYLLDDYPNDAPEITAAKQVIQAGSSETINPLDYVTDPNEDEVKLSRFERMFGNVDFNQVDDQFFFLTNSDSITSLFEYEVTDARGLSAMGEIELVVNQPPVAAPATVELHNAPEIQFSPLDFVSDPEGHALTITSVETASADVRFRVEPDGTVVLSAENFSGELPVTYEITDQLGGIATGQMVLNIAPPPINRIPILVGLVLSLVGILGFLIFQRREITVPREILPAPEKPPKSGVVFPNSPLFPGAITPGPAPLVPAGHMAPSGLQTLTGQYSVLKPAYLATGRIGGPQEGVPTNDDVSFGTGFLITPNHIMTNRHVYEFYKHYLTGPDCGGIEFIAERDREASDYVAFDGEPPILIAGLDIAIFKLTRSVTNRTPIDRVSIPTEELDARDMITISYPCPFEIDEAILSVVEDNPIFAVKRLSQGKVFRHSTDTDTPYGVQVSVEPRINPSKKLSAICHNASTLGGSSGAPILDLEGKLVGVHFAGDRAFNGQEAANLAMAIEMLARVGPTEPKKEKSA